MNKRTSFRIAVSVISVFLTLLSQTSFGQIKKITNNTATSNQAFFVGHVNEEQQDSLISRSAIIVPRSALKNSAGNYLNGVLDSISFYMADGCGYSTFNSTLKIYISETNDSSIGTGINEFLNYRNNAQLIFYSDEVKFPDAKNNLVFTTNHAFKYKDSSNIIILTEWIRPKINFCFKTRWFGNFVSDNSTMSWENSSGNFNATNEARFKIDIGLSLNPNLQVCSNKSSFSLAEIASTSLKIHTDSAAIPVEIDIKRPSLFGNISTLSKTVTDSTSIYGLLLGTQYIVNSKDTCTPSDYTGYNYQKEFKTTCVYDSLDIKPYYQNFDGDGEGKKSQHCWSFENPNYSIINTTYANSGKNVLWFYKYYNMTASSLALKMKKDTTYELSFKYMTTGFIENFYVVISTSSNPNDAGIQTESMLKFNNGYNINKSIQFKPNKEDYYYVHFILRTPVDNGISVYVDDVDIRKVNNCPMPIIDSLVVFDYEAYAHFSKKGNTVGLNIELIDENNSSQYKTFQSSQNFRNLVPNTNYSISFYGVCADSSVSNIGVTSKFKTRCHIDTLVGYHNKILQQYESWECLDGPEITHYSKFNGIFGNGLLVDQNRIIEGSTVYLQQNDSITVEVFNNPYNTTDTTSPQITYYIDGDSKNRDTLSVKTSLVSFTNFKKITASFKTPKSGRYTFGVYIRKYQNPILDELSIHKTFNCNSIADILPIKEITERSALISWKLKDTSNTKTLVELIDIYGNSISLTTQDTKITFNNLTPDMGYFVNLFTICGADTGNTTYPLYFKTACLIDTINENNSYTNGFESPLDISCFESAANQFEHHFGKSKLSYDQPVSGNGFLYSKQKYSSDPKYYSEGISLKTNKFYFLDGYQYSIKFDFIKIADLTPSFVDILNEKDSIIKMYTISYTVDQLSGKINYDFRIDKSGIYRVRLRMNRRYSIDNLSISVQSICEKIKPNEYSISNLTDSIRIDFALSNNQAQSLNIELNLDKPNLNKWTLPISNNKASFTFSTEEAKIYTITANKNCLDKSSDSIKTTLLSRNRILDSISNQKYWNTNFDSSQNKLDKYLFGDFLISNYSEEGFPAVSGNHYLKIPIAKDGTVFPIHHLDEGLSYSIRFLANSFTTSSRDLTMLVISQDFKDTILNTTNNVTTSSFYKEFIYDFNCTKKGLYFIKFIAQTNIKTIFMENFSYRGFQAPRNNTITNISQKTASTAEVKWTAIKDNNIKHCVINSFPYEELNLPPISSDTISFGDTSYLLNNIKYNKEYSVQLQFLDSAKNEYCLASLAYFISNVKIDTLQFVGDVFNEDFEKTKSCKFVPNGCNNNSYIYAYAQPYSTYLNNTTSGLNSYKGRFINKAIYLFKDSIYLLSVNAQSLAKTFTPTFNFITDTTLNGSTITPDSEFKRYTQTFIPPKSGFYELGFYYQYSSIAFDDFQILRIDSPAPETPILRKVASNENWIKLSWNKPKSFTKYIIERESEGVVYRDTIFNANDTTITYTQLPLEKTFIFKLYYNDNNKNSYPYKYISGHNADTITYTNLYIEDYESESCLKRLNQFDLGADYYRTTDAKSQGTYAMTFDYKSGIYTYNVVLAKVYLKANESYDINFSYKASGNSNINVYFNDSNTSNGASSKYSYTTGTNTSFISGYISFTPSVSKTYYIILKSNSYNNKLHVDNIIIKRQNIDCSYTGNRKISFQADSILKGKVLINVSNTFDAQLGIEYTVKEKKYDSPYYYTSYTFTRPEYDTLFFLHNLNYSSHYSISAVALCQSNITSPSSDNFYFNTFCNDSIVKIDSNHSFLETFDNQLPLPDCWTFSKTTIQNKPTIDNRSNSEVLAFPEKENSYAISKKFELKASQSYALYFDYYIKSAVDTIFYAIYDADNDTIIKNGYVSTVSFNSYSTNFKSLFSGTGYIRFYSINSSFYSNYNIFIDNLSLKIYNNCATDNLELTADELKASTTIQVGSATTKNIITVVDTRNWAIDTFILSSSQTGFTYTFKNEFPHIFKIQSVCKSDTGNIISYHATRQFQSINVENGWCENFDRLEDNQMQPGWSATGARTVFLHPTIKIGECLGITNDPQPNDYEKEYKLKMAGGYFVTRRVYYIQSPKINFDVNKLYNLNLTYLFGHGKYECCRTWAERGIDSIFAELYDETTNYKQRIGADFPQNGNYLTKNRSVNFPVPYSGKFKIRIYAHVTFELNNSPPVNFLIDNFCLQEINSCMSPPQTKITYDTISKSNLLSWTKLSSAKSGYMWYMTIPSTNKIVFSGATSKYSDTSQVLFDIEKGVNYNLYVRSNCTQPISDSAYNTNAIEETNLSAWSEAFSLSTECFAENPNDNEVVFDFEKNLDLIPSCWLKYNDNWSIKTPFNQFGAQNSKSFLHLQKTSFDSIATGKLYLTKDTAYVVKLGIQTDGRKGINSVSAWLEDENNQQYYLGDFGKNLVDKIYTDKFIDFKPPYSGEYRLKIKVNMYASKIDGSWGLALDNLVIRKSKPCKRPVLLSHDGLNKEKISIQLDSATVGKNVVVQFRFPGNTYKYTTLSVNNNSIEFDRKKELFSSWSTVSFSNVCGIENEYSSEFIVPPKSFDSIQITVGNPYFEDFNTEIEPLSAINGWDYHMPSDFTIEDYGNYKMSLYDKSYLRMNYSVNLITPSTYIGTTLLDLDKYETYSYEFRLNKDYGPEYGYGVVNELGDTIWLHTENYYSAPKWVVRSGTFKTKSYGAHRFIFCPYKSPQPIGIDNLKISLNASTCAVKNQAYLVSIKDKELIFKLTNSAKTDAIKWKVVKDNSSYKATGIYNGIGYSGDDVTIKNLKAQSKYSIFTQRSCSAGDTSQWQLCSEFTIDCDKDSLVLNGTSCEDFEKIEGIKCYINNSWKVSSEPIGGFNTTNGKTYLYQQSRNNANLMSGYFLAKRDESIDVSMLLFTDSVFGLENFSINLINLDNSKSYKGFAFNDTILKYKNYKTIPLRIPSDGLYRLSIDGVSNNGGFILLDDICITKTDRCLAPLILSSTVYADSIRLAVLKPIYTDSVSVDIWKINREGTNFVGTEYHGITDSTILLKDLQQDQKYKISLHGFCSGQQSIDSSILSFKTDCSVDTIQDKITFYEDFEKIWMDWSSGCYLVSHKNIWEVDTIEGGYNSKTSLSKYNGNFPFYSKKMHLLAGKQYEISFTQRVNGFGMVQEMNYGLVKDDSAFTYLAKKTITSPTNTTFQKYSFIFSNDSNTDARFFILSKGGNYVYFDDLSIKEHIPCDPILNSRVDNLSNFGAQISWQNPNYPYSNIQFIIKDQESWTTQKPDTTFYNDTTFAFKGLYPGKSYLMLSKTFCPDGDSSIYSDSLSFIPICPIYSEKQFNQFGSLDRNDSNWYCWSLNNTLSDKNLNWSFTDSLIKENILITDFNDKNGTQYLSAKGIINGNQLSSSVKTPIVNIDAGNKLLQFKLTNNKSAKSGDEPKENNTLFVLIEDSLNNQRDTLLLFNGMLPNDWSNFNIEIPKKYRQATITFNYLQNADSTHLHALAIDDLRISTGTCSDLFIADNLSNISNNSLCLTLDSNLYIGKNDELSYVAHLKSFQGNSLNHINSKNSVSAYNLSDSFSINMSHYFITSSTVYNSRNTYRMAYVDSLKIAFSKKAFNALLDSVFAASMGQRTIQPEEIILFSTSENIDIDSRAINQINTNKLDSLTFGLIVKNGTFNIDNSNDKYLINLLPNNVQKWLSITAYGQIKSGAIAKHELTEPNIYPNPFSDHIIIKSTSSPIVAFQITDMSGRKVFDEPAIKHTSLLKIDTKDLLAGVYTINITIEKKSFNYKLVKL